jgi:hypothetical protein
MNPPRDTTRSQRASLPSAQVETHDAASVVGVDLAYLSGRDCRHTPARFSYSLLGIVPRLYRSSLSRLSRLFSLRFPGR